MKSWQVLEQKVGRFSQKKRVLPLIQKFIAGLSYIEYFSSLQRPPIRRSRQDLALALTWALARELVLSPAYARAGKGTFFSRDYRKILDFCNRIVFRNNFFLKFVVTTTKKNYAHGYAHAYARTYPCVRIRTHCLHTQAYALFAYTSVRTCVRTVCVLCVRTICTLCVLIRTLCVHVFPR